MPRPPGIVEGPDRHHIRFGNLGWDTPESDLLLRAQGLLQQVQATAMLHSPVRPIVGRQGTGIAAEAWVKDPNDLADLKSRVRNAAISQIPGRMVWADVKEQGALEASKGCPQDGRGRGRP